MNELVAAASLFLALLSASGCDRGGSGTADPKKRLNEYISRSFAVSSVNDRNELADYLTGGAKARLFAWSDEQFRQAFIDSKRQFIKLAFDEVKNISPSEVDITYELTYLDQAKGRDAKVTNKKLCQMTLEQGKWLINEVKNIKELVEYRNELSLP